MSRTHAMPRVERAPKGETSVKGVAARASGLGEATRERLINAAGEVFAEVGFREATVRDICTRAGVNIAAVNYYFGDKAGLYSEVLRHTHAAARAKYPLASVGVAGGVGGVGSEKDASADEALRLFVRMFMTKILDEGRPAWHGKLMAREMVEPTKALDEIVESTIRPTWAALTGIVARLVSRDADDLLVRDCSASVIGQCLMFCHCRPVIDRLFPESRYTAEQIARLSAHIARFSLAAMGGVTSMPPPSCSKTRMTPPPLGAGEERRRRKAEPTPQPPPSGRGSRNGGRT